MEAKIFAYVVLNGIQPKKPIKFRRIVTSQQEIEEIRAELWHKHLHERKKSLDEKYANDFKILFSIRQKGTKFHV